MAIPPEYQQLAARLGVTQPPGQSDDDFIAWLNDRTNRPLVREATELGAQIQFGMKSNELRQLIYERLLELLQKRGFVPDAQLKLGERTVKITKIVTTKGRIPTVTVHYWILHPWTNKNNQGRANHKPAREILQKGELIA